MIVRQLALLVALAALCLTAVPAHAARTGPVELGAAISNHGFDFGPAVYRDTLARYDGVTVEHDMKFEPIQPERGRFVFDLPDRMLAWSEQQGQRMHGHTLVWCADETLPRWLLDRTWTRAELLAVMEDHITRVLTRYRGRIPTWDVVNEAFNADGTVRDCLWSRVFGGLDYIDEAFRIAHRVDPTAKLFYNEWRAENPNGRRFRATEQLAEDLLARGVPLHGIGIQHHIYGNTPFQWQSEEAFRRIGALGLDAHISELDVPTSFFTGTDQEKLALQAQAYETIATACRNVPACFRLTTWGFTDRYTYHPWGSTPLPFDADYRPKPAWFALERALRRPAPAAGNRLPSAPGAPSAPATGRGEHTVTWAAATDPDGEAVTYTLEQRDAYGTAWRPIATGVHGLSYTFKGDQVEREGRWIYRVRASDRATDGPWSADSSMVVVDRGTLGPPPPQPPPPPDPDPEPEPEPEPEPQPEPKPDPVPSGDTPAQQAAVTEAKDAGGVAGPAPSPVPPAPTAVESSSALPRGAPVLVAPVARILQRRVRATRSGRVRILLTCPRGGETCRGRLRLGAARSVAFAVPAGSRRTVTAPLPADARRRLAKRRTTTVVATIGRARTTLTVLRAR